MKIPRKIVLQITDINNLNKKSKIIKAIAHLTKALNIPATIKPAVKSKEEPFPYQAQDDLFNELMQETGLMMDQLYSMLCNTLGMKQVNTFSKAIDPNAPMLLKNEIYWNPETKRPMGQKELNRLLEAVDKFLTKHNPGQKIVLSNNAIARIIASMRKNQKYEDIKNIKLKDLKYKKTPIFEYGLDKIIKELDPDPRRIEFRERVIANHITGVTDQVKAGIRNVLDDGYLAGKTKSEISQDLFDNFGSNNKNWKRIIDTEMVNVFNSQYMDEQKKDVPPGKAIYYIRREFNDDKTCKFCTKANDTEIIARWSETALSDDKIDDPVASIAIWDGKSNIGRNSKDWWWAQGGVHPNCYSDDTEVLTDAGWKLFKDVLKTDKIMSINPETKEIDYLNHKGLIAYDYEGDMIHFDGLSYDKLVTPNHNCLYSTGKSGNKLKQGTAESLLGKNISMPRAIAKWQGENKELERQAEIAGLDALTYSKLWGWFLSEGNVRYSSRRSEVKLTQKYTEKIMNDIGVNELFRDCKEAVYIFDRKVVALFSGFCGVHAEQKYIPEFMKNASKENINAFLNSFMLGDGSQRENASVNPRFGKSLESTIRTSSPKMMADLCEMIIKGGRFCSVHKNEQKGRAVTHRNGTYITKTDCYNINITKSKNRHYHAEPKLSKVTGTYSKEIQKVKYTGMVYDVELVKWHFLLVKRNGKLAWSGNCRGHWDRYYPEIGNLKF
jgi:hypothetical protein